MRFRLYSFVAILAAIFLLPALSGAQEPAAKPAHPAAPEQAEQAPPAPENMPEAPIQPVLSGPYPVMSKAAEDRARQIFQMFNHGQTSQLWASLSEGRRAAYGKEKQEKFIQVNKKITEQMGSETEMLHENMVPYLLAPDTVYSRLSRFPHMRPGALVVTTVTLNQRGQVDNFNLSFVRDTLAEGRFAGYKDTAKLKLPFEGEWLVYYGGRTPFENIYAGSDDQRFALDFVYTKNGRLFSGAGGIGSKNEDYYCFGQPILAAADGTVVKAEGGYDDAAPGKPTGDPGDGNIVEISHGNGETSVINHLKQNSLKVKLQDKVKRGDVIAECGNSGAGVVPHLHYQLQKSAGAVLPAQFTDYIADAKPVASGEPTRGQFVKNGTSAASASATSMKSGTSGTMSSKPASDQKH